MMTGEAPSGDGVSPAFWISALAMPFVRAAASADIPDNSSVGLTLASHDIVLIRSEGSLHALSNQCTHAGSRLDGGRVCAGWIACPLHGARFALADGSCTNTRLNYAPLVTYPVREADGIVEIELPA